MNKIEKLIQELCPNGVEWKKLGEVLDYEQPSKYIVKSTEYSDSYNIPVLTAGQSFILGYTNEKEGVFYASNDNPVIIFDDFTTSFHWVNFDFKVKSSAMKMLRMRTNDVLFRYVYHYMLMIDYAPVDHSRQWIGTYSVFPIPVPPLPVQTEIVRILDKFVEQQEQLEKLIELRKKQYEYYREEMLTAKEGWESFVMSEICDLKAGKAISASELNDANEYPCFGGNGIRGNINRYSHEGNYSIIGRQGALCGCVNWATGKFYATEHAVVVTPKNRNNSRFLFILFTKADLNQYKSAGAQPGLSVGKLNELSFSIPSPERQTEIVKTLDSFESSISALTYALELSKKRYEHYRDEMLRF